MKISQLALLSGVSRSTLIPIVKDGITYRAEVGVVVDYIKSQLSVSTNPIVGLNPVAVLLADSWIGQALYVDYYAGKYFQLNPSHQVNNMARGGSGWDMIEEKRAAVAAVRPYIIHLGFGRNNFMINNDGRGLTDAQWYAQDIARYRTLIQFLKDDNPGVAISVETLTEQHSAFVESGGVRTEQDNDYIRRYNLYRSQFNAQIRTWKYEGFIASVVDFGAVPILGDNNSFHFPSAITSDGLHPTDGALDPNTGHGKCYIEFKAKMDALYATLTSAGYNSSIPTASLVIKRDANGNSLYNTYPPLLDAIIPVEVQADQVAYRLERTAISDTTFANVIQVYTGTITNLIANNKSVSGLLTGITTSFLYRFRLESIDHNRWGNWSSPLIHGVDPDASSMSAELIPADFTAGGTTDATGLYSPASLPAVAFGKGLNLICFYCSPGTGDFTSVKVNGVEATYIKKSPSGDPVQIWSVPITTAGNYTIDVQFNGGNAHIGAATGLLTNTASTPTSVEVVGYDFHSSKDFTSSAKTIGAGGIIVGIGLGDITGATQGTVVNADLNDWHLVKRTTSGSLAYTFHGNYFDTFVLSFENVATAVAPPAQTTTGFNTSLVPYYVNYSQDALTATTETLSVNPNNLLYINKKVPRDGKWYYFEATFSGLDRDSNQFSGGFIAPPGYTKKTGVPGRSGEIEAASIVVRPSDGAFLTIINGNNSTKEASDVGYSAGKVTLGFAICCGTNNDGAYFAATGKGNNHFTATLINLTTLTGDVYPGIFFQMGSVKLNLTGPFTVATKDPGGTNYVPLVS